MSSRDEDWMRRFRCDVCAGFSAPIDPALATPPLTHSVSIKPINCRSGSEHALMYDRIHKGRVGLGKI